MRVFVACAQLSPVQQGCDARLTVLAQVSFLISKGADYLMENRYGQSAKAEMEVRVGVQESVFQDVSGAGRVETRNGFA